MKTSLEFDLAVLGGGSGGYAAARTAHALGLKVVLFDGAKELSGLCILEGCMPSKSLIETANRNRVIQNAKEFGIEVGASTVDVKAVRDRKRFFIEDFASYRRGQLEDGRFELVRAHARFSDAQPESGVLLETPEGDATTQWLAKKVIVAAGTVVQIPEIPGLKDTGFWTSREVLDADQLADSWVVLGGGAIALELAHYLEGIGRKVTILQRSAQLLRGQDPDVAAVVEEEFRERGMEIHTGTQLKEVRLNQEGQKTVYFTDVASQETREVHGAEILLALGRTPNVEPLNPGALQLKRKTSGHLEVTPNQLTSHPDVYAVGDICGELEVVHVAIQQGELAARNAAAQLAGKAPDETMDYRCKLFGVFTEPQVATVGLTETECHDQGLDFATSNYPFNDHGKSMLMGAKRGFVKMQAERKTGRILGASVVGPEATELIHEVVVAMHYHATAQDFATIPHYHPTLSEIWTYPAEDLAPES